jgi:hypothetical protein
MIIAHTLKYWMEPEAYWILGYYFLTVDPMGTPGFVYVSGVAFGFAWFKDLEKNQSKKDVYLKNLARTLIMCIVAFIYNIISLPVNGGNWADIWIWFILQTLANDSKSISIFNSRSSIFDLWD